MLESQQVEELICLVSAMDRPTLVGQFRAFRASFPVDFTDQFLETTPVERLRHIYVALCLQCQHVPAMEEDATQAA
jgi:hypothetical protein